MTVNKTRLRWTDEDARRLRLFADANANVDTIAKSLGRSRASVKSKAHWLNLSLAQKAALGRRKLKAVYSDNCCTLPGKGFSGITVVIKQTMAFWTAWTTKQNDRQSHMLGRTLMGFGMWP